MPIGGGSVTTLGVVGPDPQALVVDSTSVYWLMQSHEVLKMPLGGGAATTLASGASWDLQSLVVDSTSVYVADAEGAIYRITPK